MMRKRFCVLSCVLLADAFRLANANEATNNNLTEHLSQNNYRVVKPHSHTADENLRHTKECAAMGGIDITDEISSHVGNGVYDSAVCEITNVNMFDNFNKVHKIKVATENLTNTPNSSIVPVAPSGTFNNLSFLVEGYAIFSNTMMYENAGTLETAVAGDPSYSCNQSSFFGVPPTTSGQRYAILLSWTERDYGKYDSYTKGTLTFGGSAVDYGTVNIKNQFDEDKNKGNTVNVWGCNIPTVFKDSPINVATGNKYQTELDIEGNGVYDPLSLSRTYNSVDGKWRHNYSTKLDGINSNGSTDTITMVNSDGRASYFENNKDVITPDATELGTLKKVGSNYEYTSSFHQIYDFDSNGLLIKTVSNGGLVHNIKHLSDTELVVSNEFGSSLTITETKDHQPLSVKSSDGTLASYQYDHLGRLTKVTVDGKERVYHYEDSRFPLALTGVTNERDIRYVTWTYDDKGRANSSSYDGNRNRVEITYNSDTQTTLINPLGRRYIYKFTFIDGIKRITEINGEKSASCPAIGTSFQYNNRALVTLATDGRGIKTQYTYNDAGQETSRIVGYGSADAVTIKTTWDNRFNLPKSETYPDKIITYDYDNNGNLVNQTTISVN